MDESRRLAMRRAHTKHGRFCTCGKVVWGNGGMANHAAMHERRRDGHWGMTETMYADVKAGRIPMPAPKPPSPSTPHGERRE